MLASVPDLDMLAHLPRFLERLLDCLRDPLGEVRVQAAKVLQARPLPHTRGGSPLGRHQGVSLRCCLSLLDLHVMHPVLS